MGNIGSRFRRDWLFLGPKKQGPDRESPVVGLVSDLVLALVFGIAPMPVMFRWAGWLLCFTGLLWILTRHDPARRLRKRTQVLGSIILLGVFVGLSFRHVEAGWMTESAALTSGNLIGAGPEASYKVPHGYPMIGVGASTFVPTPNFQGKTMFPFSLIQECGLLGEQMDGPS
jgi:hypothetical protein